MPLFVCCNVVCTKQQMPSACPFLRNISTAIVHQDECSGTKCTTDASTHTYLVPDAHLRKSEHPGIIKTRVVKSCR